MDTRDAGHGVPDVLEVGHDPRPPRIAVVATVGVLGIVVGAVLGTSLLRDDSAVPSGDRVLLSIGAVVENPDVFGSSRYLVPVHNLGAREVTVEQVVPLGSSSDNGLHEKVAIASHGWSVVPFAGDGLCSDIGANPRQVVVRGTVDGRVFQEQVPAYAGVDVLAHDQWLRCFGRLGRAPTAQEIQGTWLVRDGEYLPGSILVRFRPTGRLVVDDGTKTTILDSARVVGRWTLSGARVEVVLDAGSHCSLGSQWEWEASFDSRRTALYLRHRQGGVPACRPDLDRVWEMERVGR